jgi:predicted metal-dependent enzyme (double-stranded beta helix superfamily)
MSTTGAPAFPLTLDASPALCALVDELAVATVNGTPQADALTAALGRAVGAGAWLPQEQRRANHERYARHLIYGDPAGLFSILAIVWAPGQMSPVHAHLTWCSVAVYQGTLTESFYELRDGQPVALREQTRNAGSLSFDGPGHAIHRLANRGADNAISLHVYGVGADRVSTGINRVYAGG